MQVELHGLQLFFTLSNQQSVKICHVMHINGPIPSHDDFKSAWNELTKRHPAMRTRQVDSKHAVVDSSVNSTFIQPVRVENTSDWKSSVEREINTPFDRMNAYSFSLVVLVSSPTTFSLALFSDHYNSDGVSGKIVLNDLLTVITFPKSNLAVKDRKPSVAEVQFKTNVFRDFFEKLLMNLMWNYVVDDFKKLSSCLPIDSRNVDIKSKDDPQAITHCHFGDLEGDILTSSLTRCKEEKVTYHGAVIAATILAYYQLVGINKPTFSSAMSTDYNMRKWISSSDVLEDDDVGLYMGTATLDYFKSGIKNSTIFWDLARKAKLETDKSINSFVAARMAMVFLEKHSSEMYKLPIKRGVLGDCNISNIGKWEHALKYGELNVVGLNFCNSYPNFGCASTLYVSSVGSKIGLGIAHKYEREVGEKLLKTFAAILESLPSISPKDTLLEVSEKVFRSPK